VTVLDRLNAIERLLSSILVHILTINGYIGAGKLVFLQKCAVKPLF
jgi:hypothetical protein